MFYCVLVVVSSFLGISRNKVKFSRATIIIRFINVDPRRSVVCIKSGSCSGSVKDDDLRWSAAAIEDSGQIPARLADKLIALFTFSRVII